MSIINLNFVHPSKKRIINVDLEASLTVNEVIQQLIQNHILNPHPPGYYLKYADNKIIEGDRRIDQLGLLPGETFSIIQVAVHQDKKRINEEISIQIKLPSENKLLNIDIQSNVLSSDLILGLIEFGYLSPSTNGYTLLAPNGDKVNKNDKISDFVTENSGTFEIQEFFHPDNVGIDLKDQNFLKKSYELLAKGLIEDCIILLLEYSKNRNSTIFNEAVILKTRWTMVNRDRRMNLINYETCQIENSKIINTLVELLNEIKPA